MPLSTVLGKARGQQSKVFRQECCTAHLRNSTSSCFTTCVLTHSSRIYLTRATPLGHSDKQSDQQLDRNTQQLDDILAGLARLREQQQAGQVQDDEDEDVDDDYEFPPAAEGIEWVWWRAEDAEAAAAGPAAAQAAASIPQEAAGAASSCQQESPAVHSSQVTPAQQQQQQQPQEQQQRQAQQLRRPAGVQSSPAGVGSRVRRRRTQQQPGQ